MAYKLKFTGASTNSATAERVNLTSSITLNANTGTDNLRVEIEFELDSLSATNTLCFAANFCRFQILNTGQISVQYRNQTNSLAPVTSATGVISVGVRYVLALELDNVDRNARIFLDGVQVGVVASRWGTFTVDRFGLWPENSTFNGSIYRATCYQNGVIVNDYAPSASNGTGSTLIDTVGGNNGTLVNFPTNSNQWVFYDDGGGSTEQTTTSGGIVSTLAGGSAFTQIINEQVLNASGITAAVAAGIASNGIVNEQVNSTGGIASAVVSGSTSISTINEQAPNSSGIVAAIAGATASTQVINEQTSEQIVSSGGIAASIGSASASTQVIHEQVVSSSGAVASLAASFGVSTVIEQYTIVQVVQSGGISSAYMSSINTTSQVVEQIVSSGGVAAAVMTGSASTTIREFSGNWGEPTILFSEPLPIEQISLTFDQLGRPLVFYRVGENTLKLYWYDPVAQQNVTTTLTTGKDPTACFDFPQDTGQSFTDALLFYVRDDQVFMRVQRDRYEIEYPCPAIQPGLKINSAGLRVDNRLQVIYQYKENNFSPPSTPIPPIIINPEPDPDNPEPEEPVINIVGVYYNSGNSCFITDKLINVYSETFKIGFTVVKSDKNNQYLFGSNRRDQFYGYIFKQGGGWYLNIYKAGAEKTIMLPIQNIVGQWELTFNSISPLVNIKKDGIEIFNGNLKTGIASINQNTINIVFSGSDYNDGKDVTIKLNGNAYGFVGIIKDCWIEHNNNYTLWNVNQINQVEQPDTTNQSVLLIKNHNGLYWQYEKV